MSAWPWVFQCRQEYRRTGDRDRLQLTYCWSEAFKFRETDPNRAVTLLAEARQCAEQLGEPWWALYCDSHRVMAMLHFQKDYRHVLDPAVRHAVELTKPLFAAYPDRFSVYDNLITSYLGIDAVGYAAAIEQALHELESVTVPDSGEDRYLLLGTRREFAKALDKLEEGMEVTLRTLALADADSNRSNGEHHGVFNTCDLCWFNHRRGDWDAVANYADRAAELARKVGHQCELSEAVMWQAVVALQKGDADAARSLCRSAIGRATRLKMPLNKEFYDALALYYELTGNLAHAVKVREREREVIDGKGRLAYECQVRIKRCRLLAALGTLTEEDVADARAAAGKLRAPEKYLAELERVTRVP